MLQSKLSPFWWTRNSRYFIYFLRELSGPVLALYAVIFIIWWIFDPAMIFTFNGAFQVLSWVALVFALIHALTWFWVTSKIVLAQRNRHR